MKKETSTTEEMLEETAGHENDSTVASEEKVEESALAKKSHQKGDLVAISGIVLIVLVIAAMFITFPPKQEVIEEKEESPIDEKIVDEKQILKGYDFYIECQFSRCSIVKSNSDYVYYIDGEASFLFDIKNSKVEAEFEIVDNAEFYFVDTGTNDDREMTGVGLILRKNKTVAFYSFSKKNLTIPFGKYDDLEADSERYGISTFKNCDYILAIKNEDGKRKLGIVNFKSGKELIPCNNDSFEIYSPGLIIMINRINEEKSLMGVFDQKTGKELIPVIHEAVWCGKYACGLYNSNRPYQIYDLSKKKMFDIPDAYQSDKEVAPIRSIVDILGAFNFGTDAISDMNDLPNKLKLQLAFSFYDYREEYVEHGMKAGVIEEGFRKLFGLSVSFTHGNIPCFTLNHNALDYDKKKNYYYFGEYHAHGGGGFYNLYDVVIDYQVTEDYHEITVKRLYTVGDDDGFVSGFYGDYQKRVKLFNDKVVTDDWDEAVNPPDAIWYYLKNFSSYKNKSPAYKYIFRKEGKQYFLVGYEYIAPSN